MVPTPKRKVDDEDAEYRNVKSNGPRWILTRFKKVQNELDCHEIKICFVKMQRVTEEFILANTRQSDRKIILPPLPPLTYHGPFHAKYKSVASNGERYFCVKGSRIHGRGVFTVNQIPPDEIVISYSGENISHDEALRRQDMYDQNKTYFFTRKDRTVIDCTKIGNCSKFMNHSCNPNCEFVETTLYGQSVVLVVTTRKIRPWEELTVCYNFTADFIKECNCKARNCKGKMNTPENQRSLKRDKNRGRPKRAG